jgi:hypothetical protein
MTVPYTHPATWYVFAGTVCGSWVRPNHANTRLPHLCLITSVQVTQELHQYTTLYHVCSITWCAGDPDNGGGAVGPGHSPDLPQAPRPAEQLA